MEELQELTILEKERKHPDADNAACMVLVAVEIRRAGVRNMILNFETEFAFELSNMYNSYEIYLKQPTNN